jgi:hypothetical protein
MWRSEERKYHRKGRGQEGERSVETEWGGKEGSRGTDVGVLPRNQSAPHWWLGCWTKRPEIKNMFRMQFQSIENKNSTKFRRRKMKRKEIKKISMDVKRVWVQ